MLSPAIGLTSHSSAAPTPHPRTTTDAAQQFEALLIEQMLKSARAGGGGEWFGEDTTGSALSELAEQQFAQVLASGGGIGLARLVATGLKQEAPAKGLIREDRTAEAVKPDSASQRTVGEIR